MYRQKNEKEIFKQLNLSSQEILDAESIIEYTADDILRDFDNAMEYKKEQAKIFKILDAADNSDIWKTYNKKMQAHVQTPVNNPITIIKEATKASIMPTSYSGSYVATNKSAEEVARKANLFFENKWEAADIDSVNGEAADYAYLHGTSGVLFGWNEDIVDASDVTNYFNSSSKSQIQARAYHPANIFPDPDATKVDEMRYLFFAEKKSRDFLRSIPKFQNAVNNIINTHNSSDIQDGRYIPDKDKEAGEGVTTFIICYRRVFRNVVDEFGMNSMSRQVDVIYLADRSIIGISKNIQPSTIPFIPLYDESKSNNFWGTSKCYKVLSMVLTLNKIDSMEATTYIRNQNPPEFISALAGLNVPQYQRQRQNPDVAFTVNTDPNAVSAFAKIPELPRGLDAFRGYLLQMIQQVSGVDSAYLGSSYGSIQTTGGIRQAVDRATMRDNTRIKNIDKFIKKELELITQFYIVHGSLEEVRVANKHRANSDTPGETIEFDPIALTQTKHVQINVSNSAPRSYASYEEAAMQLMELQMKYNPREKGYPDFITPEEMMNWLNIPKAQKNVLVERMTNQMTNMKLEEYMAVVTALGTLTQGGMQTEDAIQYIAQAMQQTPMGQIPATKGPQQQ